MHTVIHFQIYRILNFPPSPYLVSFACYFSLCTMANSYGVGGSSAFFSDIAEALEKPLQNRHAGHAPSTLLTHLYPEDSISLTSIMKAIVTGFVENEKNPTRKHVRLFL